jgi:hypothetical protein
MFLHSSAENRGHSALYISPNMDLNERNIAQTIVESRLFNSIVNSTIKIYSTSTMTID